MSDATRFQEFACPHEHRFAIPVGEVLAEARPLCCPQCGTSSVTAVLPEHSNDEVEREDTPLEAASFEIHFWLEKCSRMEDAMDEAIAVGGRLPISQSPEIGAILAPLQAALATSSPTSEERDG